MGGDKNPDSAIAYIYIKYKHRTVGPSTESKEQAFVWGELLIEDVGRSPPDVEADIAADIAWMYHYTFHKSGDSFTACGESEI